MLKMRDILNWVIDETSIFFSYHNKPGLPDLSPALH